MEPTMQPAQPLQQPSWWSRNWKWALPAGCLILLVPPLLLTGFAGGIIAIVFGSIKSTDVYEEALARAQAHPAVIEALGEPVEDRWWVSGQINATGSSGSADLAIPLRGSKGTATIYAVASKSAGRWEYHTLEVEVEGRPERIDLLAAER